jgi:hypothetical protein
MQPNIIYQQDGAPPHWSLYVREPLDNRIRDVIASVTPDMLDRTWQEVEYRLDIIRTTSGSHIEVY